MKKTLAAIMALTLALGGGAFAQTINDTEAHDVNVTLTLAEEYRVTIPSSTDINLNTEDATAEQQVSLDYCRLNPAIHGGVTVSVKSQGQWQMTYNDQSIGYSVQCWDVNNNEPLSGAEAVTLIETGDFYERIVKTLFIDASAVKNDAKYAGTYTDTLTFQVALLDA